MDNKLEIKKLIDGFYNIISGKSIEERDWESFRGIFFTDAHLMSVRLDSNRECISKPLDVETYISGLDRFLKSKDFYEYGINYDIDIHGNIACAYSEYEAKESLESSEVIKRGINLVQLVNDGDRWWILNMLWQDK